MEDEVGDTRHVSYSELSVTVDVTAVTLGLRYLFKLGGTENPTTYLRVVVHGYTLVVVGITQDVSQFNYIVGKLICIGLQRSDACLEGRPCLFKVVDTDFRISTHPVNPYAAVFSIDVF